MSDEEEAAYMLGGDMARLMAAQDLLRGVMTEAVRKEAARLSSECCTLVQRLSGDAP